MTVEKGPFKLKKLNPPYGCENSPLWEFGYDEEVIVVDGLCEAKSPAMRDRLLKLGYVLAEKGEAAPAAPAKTVELKKKKSKKPKAKKPKASGKRSRKGSKRREA